VIIGSGPAGYTAAIYCARANLKPLVIEGIQPGGQLTSTNDIENFPGFPKGVNGVELMELMRAQAERFGAQFKADEVVGVDFKRQPFLLNLGQGSVLEAKCVIIATGASAVYLGLDSERKLIGRGVSGCATCDGALYRNKAVAVAGGGDTAMEDALFLTRFASAVTVIHRRDKFRASRIMAERVIQHPKIKIIWNHIVSEVLDVSKMEVEALNIKNVVTGEISRLPVAGLFVAIGHKPNTDIFKGQVAMDEKGYLAADNTRTSVAGVFAAGDVQDHSYRQAVTAAGSGCIAAIEAERFLAKG
ncbi:MAG: thioredoxin-disulfide reductase, partial [Kiritimatiellia bacterium]|nr:thioredoxin-disulfide reductase [Kiritimatiellia bacterium]